MNTDDVIITNSSLNTMMKPNNQNGELTISVGLNNEAGVRMIEGNLNHQKAMIFDFVYDRMYRMFHQAPNSEYINSSLKYLLQTDESVRKTYYKTMLNNSKIEFVNKVISLMQYKSSIPFNKKLRDYLLNAYSDLIDNGFPLEFSLPYRNYLETRCESDGNFNCIMDLFKEFSIKKYFFEYLLSKIFYGKNPSWSNQLNIDIDSIFNHKERSIYLIKQWFLDVTELQMSMTYPITCFSSEYTNTDTYFPKNLKKQTIMQGLPNVQPFHNVEFDKTKMEIVINLRNPFLIYYAHDAKMCVRTFVPAKLYKLNSNEFFLGKGLINHVYYDSRKKKYRHKQIYRMKELFEILNLPVRDLNNNNTANRRKSIIKSIGKLHDSNIINVSKMNSERLVLNNVWNVSQGNCNLPVV